MSDIWSLGLSLVEMSIGRYPIPPPPRSDIDHLFEQDPYGNQSRAQGKKYSSMNFSLFRIEYSFFFMENIFSGFECYKILAIFELMEWIVNEPPPSLPQRHFSPEFCDFIDRW